ncbi:MAG: RHS repeat-associated core domain-containing protein, partial [Anaerohalosphaeraceae bacterium]
MHNRINRCAKTADNPYGFTGESQLTEADNLIFLLARYYAPALGRFLSRDPILTPVRLQGYVGWLLPYLNLDESPQALHPYLYGRNNPVNNVDPPGLKTKKSECDKWRQTPKPKGLCGTTDLIAQCMKCCAETFSKRILGRSWPNTWPGWFAWYGACRNTCASSEGKLGPSLPGPGKTIPQKPRLEKEQSKEI